MRLRIVVVEVSVDLLRLFTELLRDDGLEVVLATAPPVALKQIASAKPALIIFGYLFGREAECWQVFHSLRQQPELARIPVLVGMERRAGAPVSVLPGCLTGLLSRPFQIDDFLDAVHDLLDRSWSPWLPRRGRWCVSFKMSSSTATRVH